MTNFYSKLTGGFYPAVMRGDYEAAGTWPADAIEITSEQHAALLDGQAQGMRIVADAEGLPVLLSPPVPTLGDVKAALMADVDTKISDIYSRFTRFETEYVQREAAAHAFKAGGYADDAGVWVMAFAGSAGMSAQAATDLIISQADSMRAALQALGALRMGKYGIAAAASEAAAQAVHDGIVEQATVIAAAL